MTEEEIAEFYKEIEQERARIIRNLENLDNNISEAQNELQNAKSKVCMEQETRR